MDTLLVLLLEIEFMSVQVNLLAIPILMIFIYIAPKVIVGENLSQIMLCHSEVGQGASPLTRKVICFILDSGNLTLIQIGGRSWCQVELRATPL